jgi:hypothetical protein
VTVCIQRGIAALFAVTAVSLATFCGAAAPAGADSCPNAQLRAEDSSTTLPDCRSYELVTPVFKFGEPPQPTQTGTEDGDRIVFNDLGAFSEPGDDDSPVGGDYVAERSSSEWTSKPANPNLAELQIGGLNQESGGKEVTDFSHELTESIFAAAPTGQTTIDKRFWRAPIDGKPVEVGPLIEPTKAMSYSQHDAEESNFPFVAYSGADAALSTVAFTVYNRGTTNWFWGFDRTIPRGATLYEYEGTGNTRPTLVGVDGGRGSDELISECGTLLGDPNASEESPENAEGAISEDGETIFFTALATLNNCSELSVRHPAVDELYARLDGDTTTPISEPTRADCDACETFESEPSRRSSAHFQGASADGSRVYFVSEQKLFDGTRGEEGGDLYAFNFDPAVEGRASDEKLTLLAPRMATSDGGVVQVSADGTRVYFVSQAADLAANADALGETAHEGDDNLYVYDATSKRTTFVARLSENDADDWEASGERPVQATRDGRFVAFTSTNDLTPDARGGRTQLYKYDAEAGEREAEAGDAHPAALVRMSVGQSSPDGYLCPTTKVIEAGYACNGNSAEITFPHPESTKVSPAAPQLTDISEDGSKVFFLSTYALTPGALENQTAGCAEEEEGECVSEIIAENVYEAEGGQVYLMSDGQDDHVAFRSDAVQLVGATPSGSDVFFTTADSLVRQDTDSGGDIYDARTEGGFPAPSTTAACASDCQGAGGPAPAFQPAASTLESVTENVPAPVSPPVSSGQKAESAVQIRAERLKSALKACRRKRDRRKRAACEKQSRRRYGTHVKPRKSIVKRRTEKG